MNRDEIRAQVVRALRKVAPETDPSSIDARVDLRDALDLDSMDFLGFVTAVHEALRVDIPEVDYPKVRTLDDVSSYVAAKLGVA